MANVVVNYSEDEGFDYYKYALAIDGSSKYFSAKDIRYMRDISCEELFYYPLRVSTDLTKRREYITPKVLKQIRSKKMMLLVDCSFEGNKRYIEDWWNAVGNYYRLKPSDVIFLTGADAEHLYPEYNVINVNLFEMKCVFETRRNQPVQITNLPHKKFICLNRLSKAHRVFIMLGLLERGLLDECHWSYYNTDGSTALPSDIHAKLDEPLFTQKHNYSEKLIRQFADMIPYSVDSNASRQTPHMPEDLFSDMYQNVDFMLINETIYESSEGLFLTEKTFKALVNKKPFVICGQPGSIQKLRKRGYDTYDYLVDHSYDLATDSRRAQQVLDETTRLCSVDFDEYRDRIQESAEHNIKVLLDQSRYLEDIQLVHNRIFDLVQKNLYS